MYGTVSQLCSRLKAEYEGGEKITLIIWRKEDVLKALGDDLMTEEMAAEIICNLATWDRDAQHEAGVGVETIRAIAADVKYAAEKRSRTVTVATSDLEILAEAVNRFLDYCGNEDSSAIEAALKRTCRAIYQ